MAAIYTDIKNIPEAAQGCVLAVGNFDGVHKGHRALIARARDIASALGAPLGAVTFEPHPRQFFQQVAKPFRLTAPQTKQRLLGDIGVQHIFSLPFDAALSGLTPEAFIGDILVQGLKARHVVVGEDFAFGKGRAGTAETLRAAGAFGVTAVAPVCAPQGDVYSSSAVRELLREGKFDAAEEILGWPWQVEAEVVKGDQRGRELGFPTANQDVPDLVRIPYGIYAVRALIEGEFAWRDGAANFGIRPMFAIARPIFETFIFDFSGDLYGKILRVRPVKHLRAEKSFASLDALVAQMKEDCAAAKAVLKSAPV